jgi:hypothetical protein
MTISQSVLQSVPFLSMAITFMMYWVILRNGLAKKPDFQIRQSKDILPVEEAGSALQIRFPVNFRKLFLHSLQILVLAFG